jgi:hypothetical protein
MVSVRRLPFAWTASHVALPEPLLERPFTSLPNGPLLRPSNKTTDAPSKLARTSQGMGAD